MTIYWNDQLALAISSLKAVAHLAVLFVAAWDMKTGTPAATAQCVAAEIVADCGFVRRTPLGLEPAEVLAKSPPFLADMGVLIPETTTQQ